MNEHRKDVFIVHSKREPLEDALVSRLIDWLLRMGITVYEYGDWQWERRRPGKPRYRSYGRELDPLRYAAGYPEPFRHRTWEQVPDRETLDEMLGECRVVAIIGPRSGSPSPGVAVELDVLPREPAAVLASWGNQNDWLVKAHRPGYVYQIAATFDLGREQDTAALDLAHTLWLHSVLDHLAREGKAAGRSLAVELAQREPRVRHILRFSGRISALLDKVLSVEPPADPGDLESALVSLAKSLSVDEARAVARHWWGPASLQTTLPPPPSREVASLVGEVSRACQAFCDAALRQHPELVDDEADAIRLRAVHASALGEAGLARRLLDGALALPNLSNAARSRLLADRAAMALRSSPVSAQADIEAILSLPADTSGPALAQALWLRARLRAKQGEGAAVVADLSAALKVPGIAPVLRALCLHERAIARARAGDPPGAGLDLDEALRSRGLPAAIIGPARLDRAVMRGEAGDVEGELNDYTAVIDLEGVPDETRLKAHMYRGLTRMQRGDGLGAVQDFVVIRDDEAAPPEAKRAALNNLHELDPLK